MKEYITNQKNDLIKLQFNVNKILENVKNADLSSKVLTNFIRVINEKGIN